MVDAATTIVEAFEAKAAKGEMTEAAAQAAAKEVLRAIRFDGDEYVMARRPDGIIIVNGMFKDREGTQSIDNKDADGTYFSRDMIKAAEAGGGYSYYLWPKTPNTPPVRKATYSELTPGWKWVVSAGVYLDAVETATWNHTVRIAGIVAAVALLSFAVAFWLGRRITAPILSLTNVTHRLADGELSIAIPGVDRRDEIGTMAAAVSGLQGQPDRNRASAAREQEAAKLQAAAEQKAALNRMADKFESEIGRLVGTLSAGSTELEATAQSMTDAAHQSDPAGRCRRLGRGGGKHRLADRGLGRRGTVVVDRRDQPPGRAVVEDHRQGGGRRQAHRCHGAARWPRPPRRSATWST